jgi:hypothetical protein
MGKRSARLWGTDGHEGRLYRFTAALFGPAPTGPYPPEELRPARRRDRLGRLIKRPR